MDTAGGNRVALTTTKIEVNIMWHSRKAEMGIGTLIIFIALLLVAAIAAGVLIQTSGSLQEKALTTGDQAKGQIATNVRVVEVSATDGSDGTLTDFFQIVKLAPGSDPIKISQVLFTLNSYDRTATLKYRGVDGPCTRSNTGYNTRNPEEINNSININSSNQYALAEDYDDDEADDSLYVDGAGNIVIQLSGVAANYTVPPTSVNCAGANATYNNELVTVNDDYISTILFDGLCGSDTLWATGNMSITITPARMGQGYFAVEYLQRGANPIDGNLQRGDVIKICYESPRAIAEDEKIRLNFIPKIGTPTLTEFITPEVISTERVYLYP